MNKHDRCPQQMNLSLEVQPEPLVPEGLAEDLIIALADLLMNAAAPQQDEDRDEHVEDHG